MVKIHGWESKTLGTLINEGKIVVQTGPFGTVLSAKEFVKYGIPVVAVREIREGYIQIFDETPCVSMQTYNRLSKYNLVTNDLVFARKGNVERSALIPLAKTKYFLGSDGICLRVITKNLLPQYLLYAIQSNTVRSFLIQNAYGTTMAGLNEKILSSIPLFLPVDIDEQSAIAETLSDIDRLISSLQKLIEKKKAIKQGAMEELLTGKKRLPGFCSEWSRFRLGNMTEIYSGGTPNTAIPEYWGGSIPWMSSGELNNKKIYDVAGRITQKGMQNSSAHLIPKFCVLIGLAGQGKTRGTAAYNYISLCTNQSIAAIYPNNKKFDSRFLYYIIDSMYESLRELSSGDGGRGGLTKGLISNLEIYMPCVIEQREIAQVLSDMDSEIEQLEKKLAKYQQIKQGMMQELLTGRIRLV